MSTMKFLAYIFLFFWRFVLFPVYFLSGFCPRRRDLWVFGSWGGYRFADNSAAFFLYCQEKIGERVKLVWISRDRSIVQTLRRHGNHAYWIWSPGGMLACLRADVHLFDCFAKDTNFWLSRGAKKINLWSGVPLKVFERDIDNPKNRYYRLFHGSLPERWLLGMMMPWHLDKPDLIIATSAENASITRRAFGLSEDRVIVTGFPRNDVLLDNRKSITAICAALPESFVNAAKTDRKIFLYLPTFRDTGKEYMKIDWEQMDRLMSKVGAKLFFKKHPVDRLKINVSLSNVIQLPQSIDIYNALPDVDVLISDYSSVLFDYMLLGRPIIYYMPDLENFRAENRSLLFQPEEIAVGPICSSFEELLQAMEQAAIQQPDVNSKQRDQTIKRLFTYVDSHSSKRVLSKIDKRYYAGDLLGSQ